MVEENLSTYSATGLSGRGGRGGRFWGGNYYGRGGRGQRQQDMARFIGGSTKMLGYFVQVNGDKCKREQIKDTLQCLQNLIELP